MVTLITNQNILQKALMNIQEQSSQAVRLVTDCKNKQHRLV